MAEIPESGSSIKSEELNRNITNPLPKQIGSLEASINEGDWKAAHQIFLAANPGFRLENHDSQGRPDHGRFHKMWDDVQQIVTEIKNVSRRFLQRIVKGTFHIDSAVCLALGYYTHSASERREVFQHQLAMFLVIHEMLEQKQQGRIPMVFQDPTFGVEEEYLFINMLRAKVVQHPACLEHITKSSFVFAIGLPSGAFADTVVEKLPALYIGNTVDYGGGTSFALAERYIRHWYLTNDHEMTAELQRVVQQTNRFVESYRKDIFNPAHDDCYPGNEVRHFKRIYVHRLKNDPNT
ncbi:hypothetical protein D6D01_09100 [Aureobasidium pullulans]|uniref:SRR1-like domain-containing protein n=1 Tax=Aureobasidium pullulans TaxID=5580 RepID=A0A4S9K848_AURPU|nr:hypothetical protein D6D01_09100 [Aureobasidium pullulans]